MVILKRKRNIIFILGIALIFSGLMLYHFNKNNINTKVIKRNLTTEQKEYLKYTYEIPNDFNVLDIISENELLSEDDNKLKAYDLTKNEFTKTLADINKGYYVAAAKTFSDGVIWLENNREENSKSKLFIKYSSDNKIKELDKSNSNILPSISVSSNYLTYYIVNSDNNIEIKLFDLKDSSCKVISSYQLENNEGEIYISTPNTNDSEVIWSGERGGKSTIYIYNIKDDNVNILSEDDIISSPVIKNKRIFAVARNDFFDSEINDSYASDFIVEYNKNTMTWDKFEENRINDYIKSPRESVIQLSTNPGPLSWLSTFKVKNLYDLNTNEFLSLNKQGTDLQISIQIVKNNVVYYNSSDYEDKKSKLIYIFSNN